MGQDLVSMGSKEAVPATGADLPSCETELGRRIVQLRRRKGWGRRELAKRLGVPQERLAKWEQGANTPTLAILAPLARTLEVTLDELLTGEPPPGVGLASGQKAEARRSIATLARLLGLSRDLQETAAPKEKRP